MKIQVGEGHVADLAKDKTTGDWKGFSRGLYLMARQITGHGGVKNWNCRAYPDRRPTGHHGALIVSSKAHKLKDAVQEAVRLGVALKDTHGKADSPSTPSE